MSEQKLNIYPGKEKVFEKELKLLDKASLSPRNKKLITRYHNYLFSTGSGAQRVSKLSCQLRRICPKLRNNLDSLNKGDVMDLIALYSQDLRLSEATRADYRRALKQFFRWFKEEDSRLENSDPLIKSEAQKFYKFLETEVRTCYKLKQADPNTIITDEDCAAIVENGCGSAREKAFISLLHETGCRIGEFLNMKLGDVQVKDNYAEIRVDGKTGKRTIFVAKALPHLIRFLEVHPYKNNKQSYLWLSEAQHNHNDPLLHKGAQRLVDRCFECAGIQKKHNLHWFRHSRATILAPKLTEAILCKYMGWSIGSDQVKTYSHLSVKQLEDVMLSLNGLKSKEEEPDKPVKCICGALNAQTERYCYKCFKPLKVETVIQDQELINSEINKTVQFMMEIAKNPEMLKAFEEFKKNSLR
jgi:site-specific recombinase XerD